MTCLADVQKLYKTYLARTKELTARRRPGDGLLGFGPGPDQDPCHDAFSQALKACLAEEIPSSGETAAILHYIYEEPFCHEHDQLAYWMLLAVHGLTVPRVKALTAADAAALWTWYRKAYPPAKRLPAQKQVLRALKERGDH
ncbi:MAG: hypothetical protein VB023_11435 [Oscillibacter sp.]|nr:hypothetical protein [Oscillibacter sp.]